MSLPSSVLVAGATGRLGRPLTRLLVERGVRVRVMGRRERELQQLGNVDVRVADALERASLSDVVRGVDAVFSCLGASVSPDPRKRASFAETDERANCNLIDAAVREGVRRFAYVSVFGAPQRPHLEFTRVHERVVEYAKNRGLEVSVIRPTAFFSALRVLLYAAKAGVMPMVEYGHARINPIHEEDLAGVCLRALGPEPVELDVGGPRVHTRREIAELAFAAVNRRPRLPNLPAAAARFISNSVRTVHPRLGHLTAFAVDVLTEDCVAPQHGTKTIDAYFRTQAATW